MSWLYSRALVEAFSEATCSAGAPSALSSGNPTPQAYLPDDRMTAFSRLSRFGMMFAPLTESLGADVLMWCQEDSRARTSALPEKAQESPESGQECGPTWRGSLAKFDPDSRSWKTVQLCLLEDLELSSVTWPRSGMTANGQCWELPTLERRTSGTGFGWLLPTPCSSDPQLERRAKHGEHYTTSSGSVRRKNEDGTSSNLGLAAAAQKWPTPTSVSGNQVGRLDEWGGSRSREVMRTLVTPEELGGSLNPTWVEWLMGWPLGWTDLKPLETGKSLCALQQHGECSLAA